MRPAITGDARALREALESAAEYGNDYNSLRYWLNNAAAAIDLPEPEKTVPDEGGVIGKNISETLNRAKPTATAEEKQRETAFVEYLHGERSAKSFCAAMNLPEPESTAKAEEEPNYTCAKCGKFPQSHVDSLPGTYCRCNRDESNAAANRRIKELERVAKGSCETIVRLTTERDAAYAKGAEGFRESVAKRIKDLYGFVYVANLIRSHPIPKPREETP